MQDANQEKIEIGSEVGKEVNCSICGKLGTTDEFITAHNQKKENIYLCKECKEKLNTEFENETKNPRILPGVLGGLTGAIIGGVVWYYFTITTNYELGYISLGLGYLIGFGVYFGAGKKRGQKLQIISAILAILAIIVTEKYIFQFFVNDYLVKNPAEFPEYTGENISISFLNPEFWKNFISPIGLFIYAIGVYIAFKFCKPQKI